MNIMELQLNKNNSIKEIESKERFISICKNIKRPGIMRFVEFLEKTDFFTAPASTRYHLAQRGGLLEHSLNVYDALLQESEFLGKEFFDVSGVDEDSFAIVALFHDICKINKYQESTRNVKNEQTKQWEKIPCYIYRDETFEIGHGAASVIQLQHFVNLTSKETQAIYWHMGAFDLSQYSNANGLSKAFESNVLAFALHRADMLATYKIENKKWQTR